MVPFWGNTQVATRFGPRRIVILETKTMRTGIPIAFHMCWFPSWVGSISPCQCFLVSWVNKLKFHVFLKSICFASKNHESLSISISTIHLKYYPWWFSWFAIVYLHFIVEISTLRIGFISDKRAAKIGWINTFASGGLRSGFNNDTWWSNGRRVCPAKSWAEKPAEIEESTRNPPKKL